MTNQTQTLKKLTKLEKKTPFVNVLAHYIATAKSSLPLYGFTRNKSISRDQ